MSMLAGYDSGWNRLPHEKDETYQLFCMYRDLGPLRSYRDIANRANKRYSTIAYIAQKFDWNGRVAAFDEYNNYLEQVERRESIRKMNERQAHIAETMLGKALERIQKTQPDDLSPMDAVRWADTGQKMERLARGEATENISQKSVAAAINLSALSDEELFQLEFMMKRASGIGPQHEALPMEAIDE